MSDIEGRVLRVSYDGHSWRAMDEQGNVMPLMAEDAAMLPELPDGAAVSRLLLPAEQLLCRAFALPLQQTRLIDREILAQELEEHSAETPDAWWLAWQAGRTEQGVAGLMFGLPEAIRMQIETHEGWRQVRHVGVDVRERLQALLSANTPALADAGTLAVLDADAQGVCFGVWSPADDDTGDGFWLGMRRLNRSSTDVVQPENESIDSELTENIRRSLQAMGWNPENGTALGRLPADLLAALKFASWQGEIVEWADLPGRNEANLAINTEPGLNFRHTSWRAGSSLGNFKPWRRALALAALLAVIWVGGMMWQNHRLAGQLAASQQRIVAAFHKGLPLERVMIDPLAQLRKAAGGQGGKGSHDAAIWLRQMDVISKVHQQMKWKIKTLSFQDGVMSMSGVASDLQTLNRIRAALQKESGKQVTLKDTDLSGNQVTFRMAWS